MHSHILPECDHGSDGVETSLSQLRQAVAAGVDTILSTSHFYLHENPVDVFLERREHCYDELQRAMPEDLKNSLNIVLAAEVTLEVDLAGAEGLEKLCMGNTNNILIEMPTGAWTPWVYQALSDLVIKRRLRPILAHIDRYISDHDISNLLDMGMTFQVNAAFIESFKVRRKIMPLLADGHVLYLGSDVHTARGGHYEKFSKATKKLGSYMNEITEASRIAIGQKKPTPVYSALRVE